LRVLVFLVFAAALMPLGTLFPFAYPLLLLALTFAFDRRAVATLGLDALHFALIGAVAGVAMYAIRALGAKSVDFHYTWPLFAFMLSSVLTEELLFRGYAFKSFADKRRWTAIATFSVLFAVYHWMQWSMWSNATAMALTLISTGLAHVFFALALLRSRTLWFPVGLHLGWNVAGQALRLSGESFIAGYLISLAVLLAGIVVLTFPGVRSLPATSSPAIDP